MSLERQVRIATGSLVFVGLGTGMVCSSVWLALQGFVGAGLMFAGVTDTCSVGMMLARMPWNRVATLVVFAVGEGLPPILPLSWASLSS